MSTDRRSVGSCEYLLDRALSDHWRPSKCKMVVVSEDYANALVIHVDPARPHAWHQEPFFSEILQWVQAAALTQRQVIVWEGNSKIVLTGGLTNELSPSSGADLTQPQC